MRVYSPLRSFGLVCGQFTCLGAIVLSGPLIPPSLPLLGLLLVGVGLGVWVLLTMRLHRLSVLPDPLPHVELVNTGPYRLIRHPMYTSLLIASLAWMLAAPTWWRWGLWFCLLVVLVVKLRYEEQLLQRRLPGYDAYRKHTWRLVPFVW